MSAKNAECALRCACRVYLRGRPWRTSTLLSSQPAIERSRIDTLVTCAYIREAETVLIKGAPGVGKTHLAVGLGVKAVQHGFSAQFYRLDELKL